MRLKKPRDAGCAGNRTFRLTCCWDRNKMKLHWHLQNGRGAAELCGLGWTWQRVVESVREGQWKVSRRVRGPLLGDETLAGMHILEDVVITLRGRGQGAQIEMQPRTRSRQDSRRVVTRQVSMFFSQSFAAVWPTPHDSIRTCSFQHDIPSTLRRAGSMEATRLRTHGTSTLLCRPLRRALRKRSVHTTLTGPEAFAGG